MVFLHYLGNIYLNRVENDHCNYIYFRKCTIHLDNRFIICICSIKYFLYTMGYISSKAYI